LSVQGVIPRVWRTVLARVFARDVADTQADFTVFKLGEGGYVDVPPKQPIAPDEIRTDLASEGEALAGGGTATFTNGSPLVVGSGTAFLTDLAPGDWVKPGPDMTGVSYGSAGVPGTEYDDWSQILTVDSNIQVTLTAPFVGATIAGRDVRASDTPLYTFRKTLIASDVTFFSAVPAITEIDAITLAAEANINFLGGSPEFFEIGIFDSNGVMVAYVTFDLQTKTIGVQLNNVIQIVY